MVKRHVFSRLVSPETSTDVGQRHVLDYTQHFGREEHEFGHGVRRHDQASWVPWWRHSLESLVRRYLCSNDFWLTSTSPSCSTRTPLGPSLWFSPSRKTPQAKVRGCVVLVIVRGLLRRPSLSGTPTVTFCSVHIHNVVAKKRDASTELLQRFHGYMKQHNVDFIGSDFNMSALSTGGDVFSDSEFSAPCKSFLWGLGALEESSRECTAFLVMPKRPYEWRVDAHGCYIFDNASLGLGPRDQTAHLPVFPHLRTTNLPGRNSIMRSEQAQQRSFERRHDKHERMRRRRT